MKIVTKRALKRIAIGLGLLIGLALLVNGVFAWWAQHRLDTIIAQIKVAGEPASLAELAPKPIAAEQNAATYIDRIAPQFNEFEHKRNALYESPLGEYLDANDQVAKPATPEQLAAMRTILDAFPDFLPALKQAVECNQYASLMDYSLSPNQYLAKSIQSMNEKAARSLANFVRWKMETLTGEGKSDEAIRLGIEMLRFVRFYDQEPLMVHFLVSCAMRRIVFEAIDEALRQNHISANMRAELEQELALHENREPFLWALRSERAFGISMTEEMTGHVPAMLRWPMTSNFFLKELDAENEMYAAAQLPLDQTLAKWDLVGKTPKNRPDSTRPYKSLIGPAILATYGAEVRRLVQARCLRVLNALGEYHERTGKEADSIAQLSLPKEAMIDPWSGKPLLMKKSDKGWVVYSVGQNGIDDGGDFKDLKDEGFGPPGYSGP